MAGKACDRRHLRRGFHNLRTTMKGATGIDYTSRQGTARVADLVADLASTPANSLGERIRVGDRSAEDEFVGLYWGRVFAMMLARTGSRETAQDLAQEALVAALEALRAGRLRSADRLGAFVHGTARNVVSNFQRARGRRPTEVPIPVDLPAPVSVDPIEDSEEMAVVRQALSTLSAPDSAILRMSLVDGMEPGQIATFLHLRPDVVRARKSRAVRRLIERLRGLSRGRRPRPLPTRLAHEG